MLSTARLLWLLPFATLATACVGPAATLPPKTGGAATYEAYSLTAKSSAFSGTRFQRKDGEYIPAQMREAFEAYPATRDIQSRTVRRGTVLGATAGLGGGLVGFTLGYNLATKPAQRMSEGAQIALYSAGAALAVGSIVGALVWQDPMLEMADTYNQELARDLGVSHTTSQRSSFWYVRGVALAPVLDPRFGQPVGASLGLHGDL